MTMLSVLVMAGVSAQDAEDGDLSAAIEVVKNTVELSKPGVYKVTYSDGSCGSVCDENDHGYSAGKDARAADDSGHTDNTR